MALAAATHWEVRGGTGSDDNGGAFAGNGSLAAPSAPSLATTTGGTLTVATWYIVINYCYYNGTTSYGGPMSAESSIVIANTTNDAIVVTSPAASTGATHYRVWGVASSSGGPYWPLGSTTGTAIGTNATIATVVTSGVQAPGVDRSQQAAAQVDIEGTNITTSVTGTVITFTGGAVGYTPTAADVGNQIRLTGGTGVTVGYRQIVAFTSTTWTVDASIVAGPITDLTAKMGGALATISSQTTTTMPASVVAGNAIWIKAATYSETVTVSVAGSNRTSIVWIGYNATRGDNPSGNDRPLIDGGGVRANCIASSASLNDYANIRLANATGDGIATSSGNPSGTLLNCKSSSNGGDGFDLGSAARYLLCEAASNTGAGFNTGVAFTLCYSHDNGTVGFAGSSVLTLCVADTNGTAGATAATRNITNCVFYNNGTSGIVGASNGGGGFVVNCIFSENDAYGINDTSIVSSAFLYNCDFYNNASGKYNQIQLLTAIANETTTDPQFVDAANGNFNVGVNMKAIGLAPGTNVGLAANSVLDLGAMQRAEPGNLRLVNGGLVQ